MKIRPGETRYRTNVYWVNDPDHPIAPGEYRVTAQWQEKQIVVVGEPDGHWQVICHGCRSGLSLTCAHAKAVRDRLEGKVT